MNILRHLVLPALMMTGAVQAQFGFGFGAGADAPDRIAVTAEASVSTYKAGEPFYVALKSTIETPWHAYFRNPATVGMPMEAQLTAPEGFKTEGPYWAIPHREKGEFSTSYSYSEPVMVWKVTPEANAPQQADFSLTSVAQVCCETGCAEPEEDSATIQLTAGNGEANATWGGHEAKVEVLGDTPMNVTATRKGDKVVLSFPAAEDVTTAYFFSEDNSICPVTDQVFAREGGNATLTLTPNKGDDTMHPLADETMAGKPLAAVKGLLQTNSGHTTVNVPVTDGAATPAAGEEAAGYTIELGALFWIICSMFLGGLILNLMPCVFPVIGLKVMSFVEMGGGDRKKIMIHSLAFVGGIMVSFWVLSIILILLSALGGEETRSWAMWMQNEWIVYIILLLLLTLGLSMYGVFEIGVGATGAGQDLQNKKGLAGAFFQGLFITVVATPCSGPFLGTAMAPVMAMPGYLMFICLTFMGLGLAFPYVVLGAWPKLIEKMPRPGAWMESLKQGLSFLLFAAAAWILSVYTAFISDSLQLIIMMVSLTIICAAFWVYGRWCPIFRSKKERVWGLVVAIALAIVGVLGSMPKSQPAEGEVSIEWQVWNKAAMEQALEEGTPVYVDFTARWCATCQTNKMAAYSEDVARLMQKHGVIAMRADKTRPNKEIDAELKRLNRNQVPTNALYVPDEEPAVTAELLTSGYLYDFLSERLDDEAGEETEDEAGEEDADSTEA